MLGINEGQRHGQSLKVQTISQPLCLEAPGCNSQLGSVNTFTSVSSEADLAPAVSAGLGSGTFRVQCVDYDAATDISGL